MKQRRQRTVVHYIETYDKTASRGPPDLAH